MSSPYSVPQSHKRCEYKRTIH